MAFHHDLVQGLRLEGNDSQSDILAFKPDALKVIIGDLIRNLHEMTGETSFTETLVI